MLWARKGEPEFKLWSRTFGPSKGPENPLHEAWHAMPDLVRRSLADATSSRKLRCPAVRFFGAMTAGPGRCCRLCADHTLRWLQHASNPSTRAAGTIQTQSRLFELLAVDQPISRQRAAGGRVRPRIVVAASAGSCRPVCRLRLRWLGWARVIARGSGWCKPRCRPLQCFCAVSTRRSVGHSLFLKHCWQTLAQHSTKLERLMRSFWCGYTAGWQHTAWSRRRGVWVLRVRAQGPVRSAG
jgi:hypothetical protein